MQLVVQIQNTNMYLEYKVPVIQILIQVYYSCMFCYELCDLRALSVDGIQDALTIHEE